jgi:hypothetical protein
MKPIGTEVHTRVVMNSFICWDTPCSPLKVSRRFGGACLSIRFHADFLIGLFLDPEDGIEMFLRNVGCQRTTHRYIPEQRTISCLPCSRDPSTSSYTSLGINLIRLNYLLPETALT